MSYFEQLRNSPVFTALCAHGNPGRCDECSVPKGVQPDPVNLPPHYRSHPSGVECITITEHFNFCLGNAIKYIWRAGSKEGADELEDLRKAAWYVQREIARREAAS